MFLSSPKFSKFHIIGLFSIWGNFGVGKTTLALQFALNIIKQNKNVLFFYTKPNLPTVKIKKIFKSIKIIPSDNFNIIQIKDFDELYKITFKIEHLLIELKKKKKKLNLIIIDSLTDLYNLVLIPNKKEKNINRNYQLNQILANLTYLNKKYSVDVLIINEVSKKNQNNSTIEIQSGGKVMNYWILKSFKIERTHILNERKFIFSDSLEKNILEFKLKMNNNGFII